MKNDVKRKMQLKSVRDRGMTKVTHDLQAKNCERNTRPPGSARHEEQQHAEVRLFASEDP
jgi:hypothetical protein